MPTNPHFAKPRGQEQQEREPEQNQSKVIDLLQTPKIKMVMGALVPRHLTPDRMIRLSVMALTRNPKLGQCHPMTLLGAFLGCSALGLEPNTPLQLVHLIPFWNRRFQRMELQMIVGYRGYIDLGRRSGLVRAVHAEVAYTGDLFEYEFGTETYLKHKPLTNGEDRGQPRAAYCYARLDDGQAFTVVPWPDVLRIRNGSQNYIVNAHDPSNPWNAWPDRMARKTAIRQLYNGGEMPLSLEMAGAVAIDERRVDYAALADASAEEIRENIGGFAENGDEPADEGGDEPDQQKPAEQEKPVEPEKPAEQGRPTEGRPTEHSSEAKKDEPKKETQGFWMVYSHEAKIARRVPADPEGWLLAFEQVYEETSDEHRERMLKANQRKIRELVETYGYEPAQQYIWGSP